MATLYAAPQSSLKLIGIDPTSADLWAQCQGLYEAKHVLHLPDSFTYSDRETGLLVHAAIHRLNHALIDAGEVMAPADAVEAVSRGMRCDSPDVRDRAIEDGVRLINQYLVWQREYRYSLVGAELAITTTAEPVSGQNDLRVFLTGRLDYLGDRLDGIPVIVDYKTGGALPTTYELSALPSTTIYALLALWWKRRLNRHTLEAIEVGRLYLRTGLYVATTVTLDGIRAGRAGIVEMATAIAAGEYQLTPGGHCRWSPHVITCPAFNTDAGRLFPD